MTKDIFSQIAKYNIRQAEPTPDKTVLLVVDMQVYFSSIAEPILENVISLITTCRYVAKRNSGQVQRRLVRPVL